MENKDKQNLEQKAKSDEDNLKSIQSKISRIAIVSTMVFVGIIVGFMLIGANKKMSKEEKLKSKLKHFNPIIKSFWWGHRIVWVGREKPLADDQLDALYDSYNLLIK